jgi:hypothetical protein
VTVYLRGELRDFPWPETVTVQNMYILTDIQRDGGVINAGSATVETCDGAIEIDAGTYPVGRQQTVIADADSAFDNINELDDLETAIAFTIADYASDIGIDLNDDATLETLPVSRLSGRNFTLRYTEQIPGTKSLKVQEWRLRIDFRAEAKTQSFFGDLAGYDDDGSGTYTGTANAVIENPADVIHFLLAEVLGLTNINTSSFTTARTDLGAYVLAGQLLDRKDARAVLDDLCRVGRLRLFLNFDDDWTVKAFTLPGAVDRELVQADGDFVTEDGKFEGEILSVTQSPIDELYNQFEIRYDWNDATRQFDGRLFWDENTTGPVGDWLTESQSRYNVTRRLAIDARWVRTLENAEAFATHLIYLFADRKRIARFQTSFNAVDLEIGDLVRLTHTDIEAVEDTTVYAGYRAGGPLATIKAGYTDPDTSATIKAGAKVEHNEGRHSYEIVEIETLPLEGRIVFTGRQADVSRSPLA